MTMEEKNALFKLEHPDSETDEEATAAEQQEEEEEEVQKSSKKSSKKKSKKNKKNKKNHKKNKKKKKSKVETLPPTINKELVVRMELPQFTGGLPVLTIELAGRIAIPDVGQKMIHPEFFDEIYEEKKKDYEKAKKNFNVSISKRRSEHREWSTVVDISIPPPSFKLVSLSSPRSLLSKTPKHVIF